MNTNADRRFVGIQRLYGTDGRTTLQTMHVVVVGLGGVGSWAAEALARSAIGALTLIDLDNVAESNVNRQIHALDGNFGKAKVAAMRERLLQINPVCKVIEIEDFIGLENINRLLDFNCDIVLDCTDDANAKVAMADYCRLKKIPLIMSGSAGGRLDPSKIQVADLAHVSGDRLLAKVRNQLRRDYQFPKANQQFPKAGRNKKSAKFPESFGIQAIFIDAPIIRPVAACNPEADIIDSNGSTGLNSITGLNCAGYGSSVCVTAAMGFCLASRAIAEMLS